MINGTLEEHKLVRPGRSDIFNLRSLSLLVAANWYLFLIAVIIAGVAARMYMRHIYPTYLTTTSILLEEAQSAEPAMDILEGFAVRPGAQNLENLILI